MFLERHFQFMPTVLFISFHILADYKDVHEYKEVS